MRRSALIVAPLLALVLVAGCDQGNNNNDNKAGDGDNSSTSDPKSDDKDSDSAGGGDLKSCIVGDWEADEDTLAAMGMDDLADLGTDANINIVFTFEKGGNFDWGFNVSGSSAEQGMTFSMDMDVSMIGTWKVSGSDQMDLTLDDATGTVTVSAAGQEQTQDLDANDLDMGAADDSTVAVTCSRSTLTIDGEGSETISLKRK